MECACACGSCNAAFSGGGCCGCLGGIEGLICSVAHIPCCLLGMIPCLPCLVADGQSHLHRNKMTSQEKYLPIDVDFHYLDEDKDSHQTMKNDETPKEEYDK